MDFASRTVRKAILMAVVICLVAIICGPAAAGEIVSPLAPKPDYPYNLTIPKAAKAPVIDGKLSPGEWDNSAVVTGMAKDSLDVKQTLVYMCYTDSRIYWAYRVPLQPGQPVYMKIRTRKGPTWWDDSVEAYFHPQVQHTGFYPTFQIIINPYGAIYDIELLRQIGQALQSWNPDWQVKTSIVKDKEWILEASLPFKDMYVDQIKPDQIWLARFAQKGISNWQSGLPGDGGWVDESTMAFLRFQGDEPVFRLTSGMSDLIYRKYALGGEIVNPTSTPATVKVSISPSSNGPALPSEEQTVRVAAKNRASFKFDKPFPSGAGVNVTAHITATWVEGNKKLFEISPAVATTTKQPEPTKPAAASSGPPPLDPQVRYAPGVNRVWVNVDTLDFRDKSKIAKVAVSIYKPGGTQRIAGGEITAVRNDYGDVVIDLPKLENGDYPVQLAAMDRNDGVLVKWEGKFTKRDYEWLGTGVGKTSEVRKPFLPLAVTGNRISMWNRTYTLDGLGFPAAINNGAVEHLSSPTTLRCVIDGHSEPLQSTASLTYTEKSDDVVRFKGETANTALKLTTSARLEADGMLLYDFTATPAKAGAKVDDLSLDIVFPEKEALFYDSVGDGFRSNWRAARIPQGSGTVWDTTNIQNVLILGHFVPYVGVCNDDRGFMWFADTPKGFSIPDDKPYVELIRGAGTVTMRVHLLTKCNLTASRTLTFGLIATPVKEIRKDWRTVDSGRTSVNSASYAWDFECKGRFENDQHIWPQPPICWKPEVFDARIAEWYSQFDWRWTGDPRGKQAAMDEPAIPEMMPYISGNFPAMGGKWLGDSADFKYEWLSPESFTEGGFVESYRDFYCYYMDKWVKRNNLRALYIDNCYPYIDANPLTGKGFIREDGKLQGGFDMLEKRYFFKRLSEVLRSNSGEATLRLHKTDTIPVYAYAYGDFALEGEEDQGDNERRFFNDCYNLDRMRAIARTQQWGLAPLFLPEPGWGPEAQGSCMLHDVNWLARWDEVVVGRHLFDILGLDAVDMEFIGYWKLQENGWVKTPSDKVLVSVYTRPHNRAVVVILNVGNTDVDANISLDLAAIGFKGGITKAMHADDYEPAKNPYCTEVPMTGGSFTVPVKRHNYRLIMLHK